MLFLGEVETLLPIMPTALPVPRGPSGLVPQAWSGRVAHAESRIPAPHRNVHQRVLISYPMYEPTFEPPMSAWASWQKPQMRVIDSVGAPRSQPRKLRGKGARARKALYNHALRSIVPLYSHIQRLPAASRGPVLRTALNYLRPGGGVRVENLMKAQVARGIKAPVALKRALATEFAASTLSPQASLSLKGLGDLGYGFKNLVDDVEQTTATVTAAVNKGARVAEQVACSPISKVAVPVVGEALGVGARDADRLRAAQCQQAKVLRSATAPPSVQYSTGRQGLKRRRRRPRARKKTAYEMRRGTARVMRKPTPWYKNPWVLVLGGLGVVGGAYMISQRRRQPAAPQLAYSAA